MLFKEARARGDRYAATNLGTQIGTVARLAADEVDEAREQARDVMATWTHDGFSIQHHNAYLSSMYIDFYTGRGADAWTRVRESWPVYRSSLFLGVQHLRIDLLHSSRPRRAGGACAAAR